MAFTTEFVMGAGGADIRTFTVGSFSNSDTVFHTFTLNAESHVAVILPSLPDPGTAGRWGPPTPSLTVRPSTGTPVYGSNFFRTSLFSSANSTYPPEGERAMDNLHLSLSATLPPGTYRIEGNTWSSSRTYTLGAATLVIIPA